MSAAGISGTITVQAAATSATVKSLTSTRSASDKSYRFSVTLSAIASLTIVIANSAGAIVRHLLTSFQPAGTSISCTWRLKNDAGALVPAGSYKVTASVPGSSLSKSVSV